MEAGLFLDGPDFTEHSSIYLIRVCPDKVIVVACFRGGLIQALSRLFFDLYVLLLNKKYIS